MITYTHQIRRRLYQVQAPHLTSKVPYSHTRHLILQDLLRASPQNLPTVSLSHGKSRALSKLLSAFLIQPKAHSPIHFIKKERSKRSRLCQLPIAKSAPSVYTTLFIAASTNRMFSKTPKILKDFWILFANINPSAASNSSDTA